MEKINGFTRRPHMLQIISYMIFFGNILIYSFIIFPMSNFLEKIISAILYYSSSLLVVIFGYITTSIDPTDEVVIEERTCRLQNKIFDNSKYEYYCNTCETHVHEESKHCKQCERCVKNFDHHCKWVNNCIGNRNYMSFLVLIIGVMLSSIIFSVFSIILTYQYKSSEDFIWYRADFYENNENTVEALMIVLWVFTGITIILAILDSNLVIFHLWLMKNNLTTYEYILRRREKAGQKIDRKKFFSKVDNKKTEANEITSCPNFESRVSNLPPSSGAQLNIDGIGIEPPKPVDWRGKIYNLFNRPVKRNKIFTETSRNTELQNDIHNDDDGIIPKISDYLIENTGCNAEANVNKNKNLDTFISVRNENNNKNTCKTSDEKHHFLTPMLKESTKEFKEERKEEGETISKITNLEEASQKIEEFKNSPVNSIQ